MGPAIELPVNGNDPLPDPCRWAFASSTLLVGVDAPGTVVDVDAVMVAFPGKIVVVV